jgi:hypothetical protein
VPTPPPTTDEQPSVAIDEKQEEEEEEKGGEVDEKGGEIDEKEEAEKSPLTDDNEQDKSDVNIEDSVHPLIDDQIDQTDNIASFVRSRSPSPRIDKQTSTDTNRHVRPPTPSQVSVTPSVISSTAALTPDEPSIRVEINEKPKPIIPPSQNVSKSRRDLPPPPPPPSSNTPRPRKQQTVSIDPHNRTQIKITVSDQSSGRRYFYSPSFFFTFSFFSRNLLLPNNTNMWDSYAKQNGISHSHFYIIPSYFFRN